MALPTAEDVAPEILLARLAMLVAFTKASPSSFPVSESYPFQPPVPENVLGSTGSTTQ